MGKHPWRKKRRPRKPKLLPLWQRKPKKRRRRRRRKKTQRKPMLRKRKNQRKKRKILKKKIPKKIRMTGRKKSRIEVAAVAKFHPRGTEALVPTEKRKGRKSGRKSAESG